MPRWFVKWVSRRYVAGPDLADAVRCNAKIEQRNACSLSMFGQEISSMEEAQYFYDEYVRVVNAIIENKLDAI